MFDQEKIKKAFSILEETYGKIPETKGCGRAKVPNGCGAFCCRLQSPSMFLVEFMYLWDFFVRNSTGTQQAEIIIAAIKNYLRNKITKGCVFFDDEKNRCLIHKTRNLYCRLYGIINKKSWMRKAKNVKKINFLTPEKDKKDLDRILEQCPHVTVVDGRKQISEKEEQEWFEAVKSAEIELGVPKETVEQHDARGGTYRSIHDHIMMMYFSEEHLARLSEERECRMSEEEIEAFAREMLQRLNQPKNG